MDGSIQIEEKYKPSGRLPILCITQLMGLDFGAQPKELGMQKLITNPQKVKPFSYVRV